MMNEPIDPITLVGKRVLHNCGNPNCQLRGTVLNVVSKLDTTLRGEVAIWWIVVQWDAIDNVPRGYIQPVPLSKIKVIEE